MPGIGGKGADKLWNWLLQQADAAANRFDGKPRAPAICNLVLKALPGNRLRLDPVRGHRRATRSEDVRGNASRMIRLVVEAGYEDYLKEPYANFRSRNEDLDQVAIFARDSPVGRVSHQLSLLTNVEAEDDSRQNSETSNCAFDYSPGQEGTGI